jgi:predicted permease
MDFITSLNNVGVLAILALPGFFLGRAKLAPPLALPALSNILTYVCAPTIIITAFLSKSYEPAILANMGLALFFSAFFYVIAVLVGRIVFLKMPDGPARRIYILTCAMNNIGYMGIPIILLFFPGNPEPLIYTVMFIVAFNLISYTWGVCYITGDKKYVKPVHAVLNPGTIAFLASLPFFLSGVLPPAPIMAAVTHIADMTLPLSMFIVGIRLANAPLSDLFKSKDLYLTAMVRLVICPLIAFVVMKLLASVCGMDRLLATTVFIQTAMPAAAMVSAFAEQYHGDGQTAASCVTITTVLCIITIPLLMLLEPYL